MSGRLRYPLVFSLASGWFALFQSWGNFHDPDAFYHAKMASLIASQGPLHQFPWLDLTTLGQHFADQHFLFHVLLIPFVRWFGMFPGTQLAAVFFAGLFVTVFYAVLRQLKISRAWFWTALLAASPFLIIRLSLGKASPLALAWFVSGLLAMATRRRWLAFLVGVGFALTHDGWIILLVCQVLYVLGEIAYGKVVEDKGWSQAVGSSAWWMVILTGLGAAAGMVLHPNFPNDVLVFWVQVFKIGLGTPFGRVFMGAEWLPMSMAEAVAGMGMLFIVLAGIVFGLMFARRAPLDSVLARRAIAFLLPVAGLFALTLKSRRSVEYIVPAFVLCLATLASLIDGQKLATEAQETLAGLFKKFDRVMAVVLAMLMIGLLVHDAIDAKSQLSQHTYAFESFRAPMLVVSSLAQPGDRVFHSDWDFFPELFAADDRLRYVSGLDPTFLLDAHPGLSDELRDLTLGQVTSTAYQIIHDLFGARFVVLKRADHEPFEWALEADPRFVRIYEDAAVKAYRVRS